MWAATSFLFVACPLLLSNSVAGEGVVGTLSGQGDPHFGKVDSCLDDSYSLDGDLQTARFNYPWVIEFDDKRQAIYVADCGCPDSLKENDLVRKIDLKKGVVSTLAGSKQGYSDGIGKDARFFHIAGMTLDSKREQLFITESGNDVIRVLDLATNKVSTFAGKVKNAAFIDGTVLEARFSNPQRLEIIDSSMMFVADTDNHAIRIILLDEHPPLVTTLTGGPKQQGFLDGSTKEAKWMHPTGVAYDSSRDALYVADHYNHAIRKIDMKQRQVTTLAGNGSPGHVYQSLDSGAALHYPDGIAYDHEYDVLYIAEFNNNCIRMITLSDNKVHVLAGGESGMLDAAGKDAQFHHPTSLDFDAQRKVLYVADQYNHKIRTVTTFGNDLPSNKKHFRKDLAVYKSITEHQSLSLLKTVFYVATIAIAIIVVLMFLQKRLCRKQQQCMDSLKLSLKLLSEKFYS